MSTLTKLKAAGYCVRLVLPDRIGITPAERLTDLQRQWVIAQRDDILSELRYDSANDTRGLERWCRFIELAVSHGAEPTEVRTMFNRQDIQDLLKEPDHKLDLHARTIVDAIKRARPFDK